MANLLRSNTQSNTQKIAQLAVLFAVQTIFCVTPLGTLPALGPMTATLAMIPIIIGAIVMGPKVGAALGAYVGLLFLAKWTFFTPNPLVAFVFSPFYTLGPFTGNMGSVVIVIVPRILVGIIAGLLFQRLTSKSEQKLAGKITLTAVLGSLVNTFGVLGGIWLFFGEQYATTLGNTILAIIGTTVLTNGIPEAVVAGVLVTAVCIPLLRIFKRA